MRRVLVLALLTALAAPACRLEVDVGGSRFSCADGVCPTGFECVAGYCERPADGDPDGGGADVDAGPDAGGAGGDAGVPVAACNPVSLLADNFEAGGRSPVWAYQYATGNAQVGEVLGALRLGLPDMVDGATAGYVSDRYLDLTGSAVSVEILGMVDTGTFAAAGFGLSDDAADPGGDRNDIGMYQMHGRLYMGLYTPSVVQEIDVQYNQNAQRHWRIREAGGEVVFETSPDGADWTERARLELDFPVDRMRTSLWAETLEGQPTPGAVRFGAVNGGAPAGEHCAAETLADDFDDGAAGRDWARGYADLGCQVSEADGEVGFTPPTIGAASYCAYVSSTAYRLVGSELVFEITEMLPLGGAIAFVQLRDHGRNNAPGLELGVVNESFYCDVFKPGGGTEGVDEVPWDAVAMRFWRLAEAGGILQWQTSPDRQAWTTRCSYDAVAGALPLDAVDVTIGAGVPGPAVVPAGRFAITEVN